MSDENVKREENEVVEEVRKEEKILILNMPTGEKGIDEEDTKTEEATSKNTILKQMESKMDLILAYQEALMEWQEGNR